MITLKTEISKTAVLRELQAKAVHRFKNSYESELQVQAYMNGVRDLLKLLREKSESTDKLYSIEDIEKCVEHWGLCKVEKEYIERFLNGG